MNWFKNVKIFLFNTIYIVYTNFVKISSIYNHLFLNFNYLPKFTLKKKLEYVIL